VTIKKGEDWGRRGALPADAPVVDSDAELAALWNDRHTDLTVGLLGGDLHRTVGGRGTEADLRTGERTTLPIDLGLAELDDGRTMPFVGHLIRRRRFWSGTTIAVMNASFAGEWNVAPRGHPNDGRLDLVEASLSFADRRKARARLPAGSHVPHPDISIRRLRTGEFDVGPGDRLLLDGRQIDARGVVRWSVVPDAMSIVI